MKFRFVGGLDCPEWILLQIAAASKMSVIKFKTWCNLVVEQILSSHPDRFTQETVDRLQSNENVMKGILAGLEFLFENAAKNRCSVADLEVELQQLGLPPEHSKQFSRLYEIHHEQLYRTLLKNTLRMPSFAIASCSPNSNSPNVTVFNVVTSENKSQRIALSTEKLQALKSELADAIQILRQYEA